MKTVVYNGKVVKPDVVIPEGYVEIENGLIKEIGAGAPPRAQRDSELDARGGWITPGLCDIHTHGHGGHWGFFESKEILEMARSIVKFGVTSFAPATVSLPHKAVISSIRAIREAMSQQAAGENLDTIPDKPTADGARILGINLEGPYINPEKKGAHSPMAIRNPVPAEIDEILAEAGPALLLVTFAPELEGGMELIDRLAAAGIVPVIGHSEATAEQTHAAIRRGLSHFTHIFNATRTFHQREPGCAFAALVDPGITAELILDNKHVHVDAAKMLFKMKTADGVVLITDSIHASGMPDGEYMVWGFKVQVGNGICSLPDGTFAGSVLTLNRAVKNAVDLLGATPREAFRMATFNPLRVIKRHGRLGALEPGMTADIAVFDDEFDCSAALIAGGIAFKR